MSGYEDRNQREYWLLASETGTISELLVTSSHCELHRSTKKSLTATRRRRGIFSKRRATSGTRLAKFGYDKWIKKASESGKPKKKYKMFV